MVAGQAYTGGSNVEIELSDRPVSCDSLQGPSSVDYANHHTLTLRAFDDSAAVSAGTYPVTGDVGGPTSGAVAFFYTSDATCTSQRMDATDGTVTLATLTTSHVAGSYSVTFGTLGTFSGSFDAAPCTDTSAAGDGGTTCMP